MFEVFTPHHPSLNKKGKNINWKFGILKWLICKNFLKLKSILPNGTRVKFGSHISLQGKIRLSGPGTVIIEDNVIISDNVDLYTHTIDAIIRIGKNTYLNGTRISSSINIEIGSNNIIADARIMDTDFHWLHHNRMTELAPPPVAPVKTKNNVWVAAGAAVLKGVVIEENSVIAFGAILTSSVPQNEIWGGSPAKKIRNLPLPGEI